MNQLMTITKLKLNQEMFEELGRVMPMESLSRELLEILQTHQSIMIG